MTKDSGRAQESQECVLPNILACSIRVQWMVVMGFGLAGKSTTLLPEFAPTHCGITNSAVP